MQASTPTRDRILDAAMELFGEKGFRGTSITAIETAAGLTPGAGGIYHHFRTKDAVLEAGLARNLERIAALRDIDALMSGLGDLRVELTILARYALTVLDDEQALLRIVATESRTKPALFESVVDALFGRAFSGFAHWLSTETGVDFVRAQEISSVAVGALISARVLPVLFGFRAPAVDDEAFVRSWVDMVMSQT